MSPAGRASLSASRRRTSSPVRVAGPRRAPTLAPAAGLDLSARLKTFQTALRSRLERREALVDVVRAVNASLEPARIAELVVERAGTWIPAPCWALVSSDLSGQLSILSERGLQSDMAPAVFGVARWVMESGEAFTAADLARDGRLSREETATVLAFPLSCRGQQVGALVALDRMASSREPRLSPAMRRALGVLLEPVAGVLDNALQLKRAEALSVTDDLTHLYNSRYLNQVLRRETKRASRSNRPLSLLFLDLDGFKSINDRHGHLFGSRALVEAAAVVKASARETDIPARFGGDEFAVVLPDTGGEGAFAVGERIRERIAAHQFLAGEGLNIRLTASVGVATLPDVASTAEELVQAADTAMYQVKDRGKNGIQAAGSPADK
jgi:diguanylate cyclase (GGDEF)-like protein